MKEILTPVQWAERMNQYVNHVKFGEVLLIGMRIKCYENNNLMLLIEDKKIDSPTHNGHFWVYDYETTPLT